MLFGILNPIFAEKYESDVQKTRTNENHLLELLKNQTSISEATLLNTINRNEADIQAQFNLVKENINKLVQIVNGSVLRGNVSQRLLLLEMMLIGKDV